ncbi:ATP-binding protein [Streptomyces azureus]|uniref:Uncharacterized protein n=1 Tax=Streptomyces azureus TaxID=146537 RepID=A0A0K8PFZ3_STRAJ|nr:uncharacterized protein SAZU_1052 [Streptomyces azureus]
MIDHAPDRSPELACTGDLLSEQSRGLRLVEALAWRWGWHRMGFDEKRVWCTFVTEPGGNVQISVAACDDLENVLPQQQNKVIACSSGDPEEHAITVSPSTIRA